MVAKVLVFDHPVLNFLIIISGGSQFYFATLEEYYVGGLHLPPGNAVTDASLMLFVLFTIFSIFGNEFL